jgi:hypothetical protein
MKSVIDTKQLQVSLDKVIFATLQTKDWNVIIIGNKK